MKMLLLAFRLLAPCVLTILVVHASVVFAENSESQENVLGEAKPLVKYKDNPVTEKSKKDDASKSKSKVKSTVYLLGKVKMTGTTYTQIAFFHDEEVTDYESCEKERIYGRRGNWRHYRHFVRKNSSFSLNANYFCIETDWPITEWRENNQYDYEYLIDVRDGKFSLQKANTYSQCLQQMRKTQDRESHTYFCAKSNQQVHVTP